MILRLFLATFILISLPVFTETITEHGVVYFSPEDEVDSRLIQWIEKENKSIYMAVYCFTHSKIVSALIEAKKRGVYVEVILDKSSVKQNSPIRRLIENGISVYVWNVPQTGGKKSPRPLMHNKFCVFGESYVWTGSFNFTHQGGHLHQENVVVFEDLRMAMAFKNQFSTIKMRNCIPFAVYTAISKKKI